MPADPSPHPVQPPAAIELPDAAQTADPQPDAEHARAHYI